MPSGWYSVDVIFGFFIYKMHSPGLDLLYLHHPYREGHKSLGLEH